MINESRPTCVIDCRVSDPQQLKGGGLDDQELICRMVAKRMGIVDENILKIFKKPHSATTTERDDFEEIVDFIKNSEIKVNYYIIKSIDRFTRCGYPEYLKLKAELPYYDRFPLVFPYAKTPDGFMGLNMHYLPYHFRIRLLDALLTFRTNTRMDETTRLKYSWQVIDGISRFKAAQPCVKQYLMGHVKTQFRKVSSDDWATAMLLPVERFVGATKQEVWAESQKIMRRA